MILKTQLMEHQKRAFEKLSKIKVGALYMEMGTGKTRTQLELIQNRLERGKIDCALWLCPCSVMDNLKEDLGKHAEDWEKVIGIAGIESLSSSIALNSLLYRLVTSRRVMLIVDESNLVKNHLAIRTERILRLSEHCEYKNILNGTPITRNETDLYAQWKILDWRILGYRSFWSFANNHVIYSKDIPGKIDGFQNTEYLSSKIAPYTYQVRKRECLSLPAKSYDKVFFELAKEQGKEYTRVAEYLMQFIEEDDYTGIAIYRLFTGLQLVLSGNKVKTEEEHLQASPMFSNPRKNPRIDCLLQVLSQTEEEKIIIFCKYKQEILDIEKVLEEEYGRGCTTLFHGEMSPKSRTASRERFEKKCRFFIANKACAGYGLNLQFCNFVIYYNNDFDLATRIQSEDRVHRIGQTKNVHYVDIYAKETLDERILECLEKKQDILSSFRREIDRKKDSKEVFVKRFLYYRDRKGRSKCSGSEDIEIKLLEDLLSKGEGHEGLSERECIGSGREAPVVSI